MLKRLFWLALAGLAGWLAWQWLRQRETELTRATPHFAPPRPFERPNLPPPPTHTQPAAVESDDSSLERVAGAAEGAAPEPAASESEDSVPESVASESNESAPERVAGAAEGAAPEATPADAGLSAAIGGAAAFSGTAVTTASENERATILASSATADADARPIEREIVGYCVRCKTKRPIQSAHEETTESGRHAARGTCPVCGANMFTFLKDNEEEVRG